MTNPRGSTPAEFVRHLPLRRSRALEAHTRGHRSGSRSAHHRKWGRQRSRNQHQSAQVSRCRSPSRSWGECGAPVLPSPTSPGLTSAPGLGHDGFMAGRVEQAVRSAVTPGHRLSTPSGRGTFSVARYTADKIVLLLGEKEAWTPIPWQALEEIPDLLRGRSWVPIGSTYSTEAVEGTLDGHLKGYIGRATGGWVAVVLEMAGVIQVDRSRPARVKLAAGW